MPANIPNTMRNTFTTWASLETGIWPTGSSSLGATAGFSAKLNSREVFVPALSRASMATVAAERSSVGLKVKMPTYSPWTLPGRRVIDWPLSAAVTRVGLPWMITFTLTCFLSSVAVAPILASSEISMGRVFGEVGVVGVVGGVTGVGLVATGLGVVAAGAGAVALMLLYKVPNRLTTITLSWLGSYWPYTEAIPWSSNFSFTMLARWVGLFIQALMTSPAEEKSMAKFSPTVRYGVNPAASILGQTYLPSGST